MSWYRTFTFTEKFCTLIVFLIFSSFFVTVVDPLTFAGIFLTRYAMDAFELIGTTYIVMELVAALPPHVDSWDAPFPQWVYIVLVCFYYLLAWYLNYPSRTHMWDTSFILILVGLISTLMIMGEYIVVFCKFLYKKIKVSPPEQ